jgi:hypothetical protein
MECLMTPADLKKDASKGPYKGVSRSLIILKKIADGREFTLNSGAKVKGTNWDEKTLTLFVGTRKISLRDVKKDPDFGGGGSGAGADITAIVECGQALVCSLVYNVMKRPIEWEDLKLELLEKSMEYCDLSETLNTIIERSPPEWVQSYVKSANILYRNYKMMGSPVYFHRGSKFMNEVYASKKVVFDNDKKSDNQQAPGSFSDDKWNPGDIWMTTLKTVPTISSDSWSSLNKDIYDLARAKKLIGVSLKKVGASAHIEEYNALSVKQTKDYLYGGFRVTSATERGPLPPFFNSIDLYMTVGDKEIQFRATSGEASWQGEIKGATAAGGKIGGGNVNFYLKKYTGKGVYEKEEKEVINFTKSKDFFPEFYKLYKKHFDGKILPYEEFVINANLKQKESAGYLFSKYINMKFIDIFLSANTQTRNKIATDFLRYAASNTDQSSFFVKIS